MTFNVNRYPPSGTQHSHIYTITRRQRLAWLLLDALRCSSPAPHDLSSSLVLVALLYLLLIRMKCKPSCVHALVCVCVYKQQPHELLLLLLLYYTTSSKYINSITYHFSVDRRPPERTCVLMSQQNKHFDNNRPTAAPAGANAG